MDSAQPTLTTERLLLRRIGMVAAATWLAVTGCGGADDAPQRPPETFGWVTQRIAFSPPPEKWRREGDNGGGMLGVRFVLADGVGECIGVMAYTGFARRDRRAALKELIEQYPGLERREFLHRLSLARAPTDDPLSEREAETARAVNAALDRAMENCFADRRELVRGDLEEALRAASSLEIVLADLLPRMRLRPERMQEPDRWRVGYERDTIIGGRSAFASNDTLIAPGDTLRYRQVFWVVNNCAFRATYQGLPRNQRAFDRLVASVTFPEGGGAPLR